MVTEDGRSDICGPIKFYINKYVNKWSFGDRNSLKNQKYYSTMR